MTQDVEVTQEDRDAAERWGTGPVYNMEHLAQFLACIRFTAGSEAAATITELRERLELTGEFASGPDGIECRNDTTKLKDARITELEARVRELTEEVEERDEWLRIVDTLPLDEFDRLGDYWMHRLCIVKMVNAIASVFVNHANENIMARFREGQRNMMHIAFVEGCVAGARNERARAALKGRSDAG